MALTAQAPAPASWARWPQHNPHGEYVVIDSGMMHYEMHMRPLASPPLQRPALGSPYFTSAPVTTPAMASASPVQYQAPVHYGGYQPFPPSPPLGSPFKQEPPTPLPERPQLSVIPLSEPARSPQDIQDRRLSTGRNCSPLMTNGAQLSCASSVTSERRTLGTITNNVSAAGDQVEFNTEIDTLMKALQAKKDSEVILKKAESSVSPVDIKSEQVGVFRREIIALSKLTVQFEQPRSIISQADLKQQQKNKRVFPCDIEGCNQTFNQKTHLEIHRRKHTGDKPYVRLCLTRLALEIMILT